MQILKKSGVYYSNSVQSIKIMKCQVFRTMLPKKRCFRSPERSSCPFGILMRAKWSPWDAAFCDFKMPRGWVESSLRPKSRVCLLFDWLTCLWVTNRVSHSYKYDSRHRWIMTQIDLKLGVPLGDRGSDDTGLEIQRACRYRQYRNKITTNQYRLFRRVPFAIRIQF